jgi:hypothetical protein
LTSKFPTIADSHVIPIVSSPSIFGFLVLVFIWKTHLWWVHIPNRIPITVKINAVAVIVLTIWNFAAAIRFG